MTHNQAEQQDDCHDGDAEGEKLIEETALGVLEWGHIHFPTFWRS